MPMTAAERQKKYIEKLKRENPEKYENIRKQHLQKVKDRQKKVKELTDEGKRKEKKNAAKMKQADLSKQQDTKQEKTLKDNIVLRRKNSVLEKKVLLLNKEIKTLKKKVNRYKFKVNNLQSQIEAYDDIRSLINNEKGQANRDGELQLDNDITPRTKASLFVDEALPSTSVEDKEKVKKKLFELNLLSHSLETVYSNADSYKTKEALKRVVDNDIIRRYKMKNKMSAKLGINRIRKREPINNRSRIQTLHTAEMESFFCRDDVSRATAGKQETKTKHKNKKQKRYLIDSMLKLHMKYKQEGGKLSYATFTRLKPFYVQRPNVNDRNTCACTRHSNLSFKANKLKALRLIETDNLSELVKQIACDSGSKDCMHSTCITCKNKVIDIKIIDEDKQVQWFKWVLKKHSYTKATKEGPKEMITKKVTKELVTGNIKELVSEFQQELNLFKKHYYNILHQYGEFKKCTENLRHDEIAIICDFSENYTCKLSEQVQSAHFGSSQNQFSLHTGVIYTKDSQPISFCTISPSTAHDPGAIWAHLNPVIDYAKSICPMLRVIHFFSDGPTTQYRQKKNFFLLSKMISESVFEYATWNFFEASHGKGPADGVGGSIKRKLDQLVAYGNDIPDSKAAYKILQAQKSKVKLFYITEEAVRTIQESIPLSLVAVTGTLSVHQIITKNEYAAVYYRCISCFCGPEMMKGLCKCHQVKLHHLIDNKCTVTQQRRLEENKEISIKRKRKKSNHTQSESSESDIDITYESSDFDEAGCDNESTFSEDSELDHTETNYEKNISPCNSQLEDSSHKENIEQKLKPNTSHTKENVRVSKIKILSNSNVNVILDEKTGTFKLKTTSPDRPTTIPEQELKAKTLPKSIQEQTETIEKGIKLELKTDKEEGRLPDEIMKPNVSEIPGSEKEQRFKMKTEKQERELPDNKIKHNKSGTPGSEKEEKLEMETDKEDGKQRARIIMETPRSEKKQRLEMEIDNKENELVDDVMKHNVNEIPGFDEERRLASMKSGNFVLAKFSSKKNKEYRFVCRIEDISHGKIVVQGFKSSKKMKNIYVAIKNDISIIENRDIVEFLSQPKKEGNCYIFPSDINVKEI